MALIYEKPEYLAWDDPDPEPDPEPEPSPATPCRFAFQLVKIGLLLILWSFFTISLILTPFHIYDNSVVTVLPNETVVRWLPRSAVEITLQGPIDVSRVKYEKDTENVSRVSVRMELRNTSTNHISRHTAMWNVYLQDTLDDYVSVSKLFNLPDAGLSGHQVVVTLRGDCEYPVALLMKIDSGPIVTDYGHIYGTLLFLSLYILIVFDLTDPTFGALLVSTTGIGILSVMDGRPSIEFIVGWVDFEILMIIICMMIIVTIMSESGIFDWMVIQTYRSSKGHLWLLVFFIAMHTGVMSTILNNFMIMYLLVPIVGRLCDEMNLRTPLVVFMVRMYTSIGGALTPVGSLPNMIIGSHVKVEFMDFTLHMLPGVLGALLVGMPVIYLTMRKKLYKQESPQIMASSARERTLGRFTRRAAWIRKHEPSGAWIRPANDYFETLAFLQAHYGIVNKILLVKSLIAATLVLVCFMIHSLPFMPGASFGWVAFLGALLLVILAKLDHFHLVLHNVDWSIVLFVCAHFAIIGVVKELGFIRWLDFQAVNVISSVEERHQTMVAILLILWTSGFISAFLGYLPVTSLAIEVIKSLAENETINVPQSPLVWALSYGTSFGVNGSLLGANSYLIAASIERQFGYRITSLQSFLLGFPMMLATLLVATVYLLIAHVAFAWH